jgi:Bacteriocin-protection, YdeI or OmpD-Associated/Domain of unknown function (DUF1905)
MAPEKFRSRLVRPEGVGTWTFATVPAEISKKAGLRSHLRVKGTIDGTPFSSSLIPRGGGVLFIVVNSELRETIGKISGNEVEIILEVDSKPVSIPEPAALRSALSADRVARRKFDALAPSHRKAFCLWISDAKKEETRARRVLSALQMLHRGETLN